MKLSQLYFLVVSLIVVVWRRVFLRRPKVPTWPFKMEFLIEMMQRTKAATPNIRGLSDEEKLSFMKKHTLERRKGLTKPFEKLAADVERSHVDVDGMDCEWFTTASSREADKGKANEDCRVVLFFHGGGYSTMSTASHAGLIARIAAACHTRIFAPNYRLAPEHSFVEVTSDSIKSYRHLLSLGFKPKNIILMGDSAGGGLAIATALAIRDSGKAPLPAGVATLSPYVDLTLGMKSHTANQHTDFLVCDDDYMLTINKAYAGKEDLKHPLVSPLYADYSKGFPPLLIHVGAVETLLDDARALSNVTRQAGIEVEFEEFAFMPHDFQFFGDTPQSTTSIDHIADFVRIHTR